MIKRPNWAKKLKISSELRFLPYNSPIYSLTSNSLWTTTAFCHNISHYILFPSISYSLYFFCVTKAPATSLYIKFNICCYISFIRYVYSHHVPHNAFFLLFHFSRTNSFNLVLFTMCLLDFVYCYSSSYLPSVHLALMLHLVFAVSNNKRSIKQNNRKILEKKNC